jgi:ribonuclease HI
MQMQHTCVDRALPGAWLLAMGDLTKYDELVKLHCMRNDSKSTGDLMDRVQEIAAAIAALQPEEKQHLFGLLAERGELPDPVPALTQLELMPSNPGNPRSPDYILIFDGGSKGNPGWGYGSYAITRVQDGAQRVERLQFGDGYTSNEAEYDTLVAALQDLIERIKEGGRQPQEFALEVRGDSTLVINQVRGTWKAKEPRMKDRRDRCIRLLRRFGAMELKTQPREESVRVLGH